MRRSEAAHSAAGETATPGRRERRKLEVRARLLAAAEALFDQHGIAATKVSEICERADVAQKTFFNHFATKQDLLRALAASFLEELLVDVEEARKRPGGTRERLTAFFACIAENALEAGPMRRELLTEIIHVSQTQRSGSANARALRDAFGALVADGLAAGDVSRAHSRETLTDMVLGAFYVLMFNWAHLEGYALRRQALAAARFLGDAMAAAPARRRR
jgi:AcrR family transcriptional regulator